jgi:hypothetical protein
MRLGDLGEPAQEGEAGERVEAEGLDGFSEAARIDADNDDLLRYVVRRYAYDPQRRERRHQIVAAFDNERERGAFLEPSRCPAGTGPSRRPGH